MSQYENADRGKDLQVERGDRQSRPAFALEQSERRWSGGASRLPELAVQLAREERD